MLSKHFCCGFCTGLILPQVVANSGAVCWSEGLLGVTTVTFAAFTDDLDASLFVNSLERSSTGAPGLNLC